jgi:hypothetical protein
MLAMHEVPTVVPKQWKNAKDESILPALNVVLRRRVIISDIWDYGEKGMMKIGVAPVIDPVTVDPKNPDGVLIRGAIVVAYAQTAKNAQQDKALLGADIAYFDGKKVVASSFARPGGDENTAKAKQLSNLLGRLSKALGITGLPRSEQPLEALERAVLGSLLATTRGLQPEMVGALGLIELQAGPRCRKVLEGLRRVGAPDDTFPFYEVHAAVDPKHGKDWVDNVVTPLADDDVWAEGMVRGARWRWLVNDAFFAAMAERFAPAEAERQAS